MCCRIAGFARASVGFPVWRFGGPRRGATVCSTTEKDTRLRTTFLDLLACPLCLGDLLLTSGEPVEDGHVMAGELACRGCEQTFPIRGGIPRLLPDPGQRSAQRDETAHRFGYEWNAFSDFDTAEEIASMATWFRPRALADLDGRTVLDAGCGMGRHAVLAVKHGATRVVGVDLGTAVEASFANTRHLPEVCIVQGDIYHPPLARAAFDAAYSLGVLHHLPDPARGFRALAPALADDGWFQVWLYGREGNGWILYGANPVRRITARLPLGLLKVLCVGLTVPVVLAARLAHAVPAVGKRMPYGSYLAWLGPFGFRKVHAIVFDHALAPVAHYMSRPEVEAMVADVGWHIAAIEHSRGMSWGVDARPQQRRELDCGALEDRASSAQGVTT